METAEERAQVYWKDWNLPTVTPPNPYLISEFKKRRKKAKLVTLNHRVKGTRHDAFESCGYASEYPASMFMEQPFRVTTVQL